MSKAFVEGFSFKMIADRLHKVLNDYGFTCDVVYLGEPTQIPVKTTAIGYSGSLPSHDGRSIVVRALPNSLVYAVLRYPHYLVESEHVYARLTPEQAILALGYIDGTSVESDGNNAALNVNHLAYYLHKCSKIKIVLPDVVEYSRIVRVSFETFQRLVSCVGGNAIVSALVTGDVNLWTSAKEGARAINYDGFCVVEDTSRRQSEDETLPLPLKALLDHGLPTAESMPNTPIRK